MTEFKYSSLLANGFPDGKLRPGADPLRIPDNPATIALLMASLIEAGQLPIFLQDNEVKRENIYDSLVSFFGEERIAYLMPRPESGIASPDDARFQNQIHNLISLLLDSRTAALCAHSEAPELKIPDRELIRRKKATFHRGREYQFDWILSVFSDSGYQRSPQTEHNGEFSVRGGIVDIYPFGRSSGLRLELFGDTLESIREFNPHSQLSTREIESFELLPRLTGDDPDTLQSYFPANTVILSASPPPRDLGFPLILLDDTMPAPRWTPPPDKTPSDIIDSLLRENKEIHLFYDHALLVENLRKEFESRPGLHFHHAILHDSLTDHHGNRLLINCDQLFHVEHVVNPDRQFIPDYAETLDAPSALKYGDLVIHSDYGVGRYLGIETLLNGRVRQDALVIEYQNNDKVYVALKYISRIFRYSGADNFTPHLANLRRSSGWESTKRSVKKAVREIAADLLRLYGQRQQGTGFAFHGNEDMMAEIERSFPHTETPDQKRVIDEIYADMETSHIMDRLVCGDVGFGKTEVAIRAAFKAVLSGKQVAVLVPTTILSIQHFENFLSRFKPFGITVEIINRFRTKSELTRLYQALSEGACDVLIGTHKMLSGAFSFKDLGLLIIDEEHRFGVRDKDKIKQLKNNVDVLTMTATPIPRTLEFSLMGLREISRIETPPKERMPIITKIQHWSPDKIGEAVRRELDRNGQIIVVSNDIHSLDAIVMRFEKLAPGARVKYAHGQMKGSELENRLIDFYHHKYDILIATTIIESGIDIPNANTLIVFDAHRFGLSQLYQIRGRVGRSHRRAYAYLIIPKHKLLTPEAEKRLRTLEYYTDLGSGYHIAMRDLEIRGSGNLFGTVQSGFINTVGYDYYLSLLNEEIRKINEEVRDAESQLDFPPDVSLGMDAYIPDEYIDNTNLKLDQYRRINGSATTEDLDRNIRAMMDRYGRLPEPVINLIFEKKLSLALQPYFIEKLTVLEKEISLSYPKSDNNSALQDAALRFSSLCYEKNLELFFSTRKGLSAKIPLKNTHPKEILARLFPDIEALPAKKEFIEIN